MRGRYARYRVSTGNGRPAQRGIARPNCPAADVCSSRSSAGSGHALVTPGGRGLSSPRPPPLVPHPLLPEILARWTNLRFTYPSKGSSPRSTSSGAASRTAVRPTTIAAVSSRSGSRSTSAGTFCGNAVPDATQARTRILPPPARPTSWSVTSSSAARSQSLFEFAGGEPAFLALARAHHERCLADPELNHPFSHEDQHPKHVERLAAYWAEVLGGPAAYSEMWGDESGVLAMHAGNGDMGDLGERFRDCFVKAMDDANLP